MRLILCFIIVVISGASAYCQAIEGKAFLYNFFGQSTTIVYTDKVWEGEIKRISTELSLDTLYASSTKYNNPNDRLVLTQQERRYVQNELKSWSDWAWSGQLFKNGKVLTRAVIDSIYNNRNQGWLFFKNHYGSRLYSFSKPIFLRNNSLCIFYSSYSCGPRCGEGKLMIFIKKGVTWVPWMEIFRWVN